MTKETEMPWEAHIEMSGAPPNVHHKILYYKVPETEAYELWENQMCSLCLEKPTHHTMCTECSKEMTGLNNRLTAKSENLQRRVEKLTKTLKVIESIPDSFTKKIISGTDSFRINAIENARSLATVSMVECKSIAAELEDKE